MYPNIWKDVKQALVELRNRDFSFVSLKDLLVLINQLESKLLHEGRAIRYTTNQKTSFWESIEEDHSPIKIGLFAQK